MKALFLRAVFVTILVTIVTSVNAQSTFVLKSATFTIPFKMKFYSTEGIQHSDTVWTYKYEHFYNDNYYHDDTLFTVNKKKLGIDSFSYFWSSTIVPRTMGLVYKLDTLNRYFKSLTYYSNYSFITTAPRGPYTEYTDDYIDFGIQLSSLPYFIHDTILSVNLTGGEFISKVILASLDDGIKISWQEKYYHEIRNGWSSLGIDSNTTIPSCYLEFIVPKNFQSSILHEKPESAKHFTAMVTPISGDIVLMFSPSTDNTVLYLYDILGRLVHSVTVEPRRQGLTLPSSLFKTGVYFANLNRKLVKFSIAK